MSENGKAQARSKAELCEKLKDLIVEKQQVQEQIRETEHQSNQARRGTEQTG